MKGRERVLRAIRRQPTDVTPWVPFVGVQGAALMGMGAHEYLRDAAHLVAGAEKARALYRPDALPVAFDLQLEAEDLTREEFLERCAAILADVDEARPGRRCWEDKPF